MVVTLSSGLLSLLSLKKNASPLHTSGRCMSTSPESMRFQATALPWAIAAIPEAGAAHSSISQYEIKLVLGYV